jgi:hypothetical protein
VEAAAAAGMSFKVGQRQNIVRWCRIGSSDADYRDKLRKDEVDIYKNFYTPFFPQFAAHPDADWVQNVIDSGVYVGGTASQVRSQWSEIYSVVPAEYITLIFHYAQQPKDEVIHELGLFMKEVLPALEAA